MHLLLKGMDQGCGSELIYVCLSKSIERDTVGCEKKFWIFPVQNGSHDHCNNNMSMKKCYVRVELNIASLNYSENSE